MYYKTYRLEFVAKFACSFLKEDKEEKDGEKSPSKDKENVQDKGVVTPQKNDKKSADDSNNSSIDEEEEEEEQPMPFFMHRSLFGFHGVLLKNC